MKKILFLMAYPLEERYRHLTQKFDGQIEAAKSLGLDTWYTVYEKNRIYLFNGLQKIYLGKSINSSQNIFQCHFIYTKIKAIFKAQKFDYCYIRNVPPIPSYIAAIKTIRKNGCKVIVEIPTYRKNATEKENKNRIVHSFFIELLNGLFAKQVPQFVDLFTLIGDFSESYEGVKAINIQNGVNIEKFSLKENPKHDHNEIHLLALALMSYWHGYDRVIEGLRIYYMKTQPVTVFLHLVGNAGDDSLQKWKQLVNQYHLEKYVSFEGFKSGVDLDQTINNADIAIGSLGLYREQLEGASSIKISEYCARGIPFVFGGKNKLLDDQQFWLEVPNDDTPIDIFEVIKFAKKVCEIPNLPIKMREYATKNMTWKIQLMKVVQCVNE